MDTDLPQGDEKVAAVRNMFDTIAPRYDMVNRIMTFRMDVGWRQRAVSSLGLIPGSVVADLACGTGDFCFELERKGHVPIGFDLSFGMLAHAPRNFPRAQADVLRLPLPDGSIDGVTCGFALRNLLELDGFFAELRRVIRPGGRIALLDVAQPPNPVLQFGHGIYFGKVVPMVGGLLSDKTAYSYLPKSVAYLPEPEVMVDKLRASGFSDATRTLYTFGISQVFLGTRDAGPASPAGR